MTTIAVMGAGSFGTAMAQVFADATLAAAATKSTSVRLWCRRPELAEQIAHDRENSSYLPAVHLPDNVEVTADPAAALDGASIVALAVPAQLLREHLAAWAPKLPGDATLLSLAKGIEIDSLMRMTEVIHDVTGRPTDQLAVLTGPNFAKEIGRREPTLAVVGCSDLGRAADVQKNCATAYFRPYINDDVVGCEIGGAAKNVIALACGIASGIGLGENAMAAIITRGLAETIRLAEAAGAKMSTMAGLAGVGDLIATCSSPQSRNRAFGAHLGRGLSLSDATAKTGDQVAEGVKSSISVHALADRLGVEMPLVAAVHGVCHQGLSVPDVIAQLFQRDIKAE